MAKIISLHYQKDDNTFGIAGFLKGENGTGNKLYIDGEEVESFIIVDEGFGPILNMIEKSGQDIFVDSYAPLNVTPKASVYTMAGTEQIPVGNISSDVIPSIDNFIILFGQVSILSQPFTYFKFKKLGKIVTVDAR